MTIKRNSTIFGKHHLSRTIIAALFSVTLIFGMGGVSLPLQPQQEVYASSQMQAPPPTQTTPSSQVPPLPRPTPICNPNSPTLQFGSTGAKVVEIQRILTQIGYGPLLGQSGIDGKFATSTQNAVKKFQQDNRLPVDGKIGPISWRAFCTLITTA